MIGEIVTKRLSRACFLIVFTLGFLLVVSPADLWAFGRRDIKTEVLEGQEIWQAEFDISRLKKGTHNVIIRAYDPAGNLAEDGAYNIRVDPKASLPEARVIYPNDKSVIRADAVSVLGIATGKFGINRVTLSLDNGAIQEVNGTEYWNRYFLHSDLEEGTHTIKVQAFDGKETPGPERTISFILDRTPPETEITSHETGALLKGNTVIKGFARDINGIGALEVSSDGGSEFYSVPFKKANGKGKGAVEFAFRLHTKELTDGPLLYILRATDVTGLTTIKPYLFYIDNDAPVLDVISPREDEAVWDRIRVTGSIFDAVGIDRFYYDWNGETVDIPIFPGDPYWAVEIDIPYRVYRGNNFRVTAVDKVGNISTVTRQFRDHRKVRKPALIIDYPRSLDSLGPNQAIYGHFAPGYDPMTVIIEGVVEELDATPSFRIPPEYISAGRGSLRLWARSSDDSMGDPMVLRTNRPTSANAPPPAPMPKTNITMTSPDPYFWFRDNLVLAGKIEAGGASLTGGRLEYRIGPEASWVPLAFNEFDGTFRVELSGGSLPEGFIHLELRTFLEGVEYFPLYYPVNRFTQEPELYFISPVASKGVVNGQVTVSGVVNSTVPIESISYTTNGTRFEPMTILSAYQKYTFSMSVNFSNIQDTKGQVMVRVTDVSGTNYDRPLAIETDSLSDAPVVILSTPLIGEVISGDFRISGLAFDDDEVASVLWRIVRKPDSKFPFIGRVGTDMEWRKIETDQIFDVTVSMGDLGDGEYYLEIVAEDVYGFRGRVLSRLIRGSTAPPVVTVTYPPITVYNKNVIFIEGTCIDNNTMGEMLISIDNGLTWQRAEVMGDKWRLSVSTVAYGDGVYTMLIRAFDAFGVEAFSDALVNFDNTPPEMAVSKPLNGTNYGDVLEVTGRVRDNITVADLSIQLVNIANSAYKLEYKVEPKNVFYENINIKSLPVGEYNVRVITHDLAENETVVSRNFNIVRDTTIAEVAIYNPMPGIDHTGPLYVTGRVSAAFLPKEVDLWVNNTVFVKAPVDQFGLFYYEYPAEGFKEPLSLVLAASFENPTGGTIRSHDHEVKVMPYGAMLAVDSHEDGDAITKRPWLSGRAWYFDEYWEERNGKLSWNEERYYDVEAVDISYDNGRTYKRAIGKENWKFHLETGDMVRGPLPILIKATFTNGSMAVRRLFLIVDVEPPVITTLEPMENSLHRDILAVYGMASDDYSIDRIEVSLRPGDKFGYSVPQFIQGSYIDTKVFGATYADIGLGLSFFDNNVKLQFQFGVAPPTVGSEEGRFVGNVFGLKLLANIAYIPLDYFFGPDWIYFSMSFALGANFSLFTMKAEESTRILSGMLVQFEFLRVTLTETEFKALKYFSFYYEPTLWFIPTDINRDDVDSMIFRNSIGLRIGIL
ncbi:hypothetical protein AGMMS49928_19270 [Spirochaetia bacterium]|nr:hypothetical protein AGMMS49928_19270 [Spirochaetia bacterium]